MNRQLFAVLAIVGLLTVGGGIYLATNSSDEVMPANTTTNGTKTDSSTEDTQQAAFTKENVAEHATKSDCWTIISGKVYDITAYVPRHPGGDEILMACGTGGTSLFSERMTPEGKEVGSGDPHSSAASSQLESYLKGDLTDKSTTSAQNPASSIAE